MPISIRPFCDILRAIIKTETGDSDRHVDELMRRV